MSNLKRFLSKAKAMSKSALSVVLALCLLMLMIPTALLVAADQPWDGTLADKPFANYDPDVSKFNKTTNPYVIETAGQFAFLMKLLNEATVSSLSNGGHVYTLGDKTYTLKGSVVGSLGGAKIELHADLDLGGQAWTPNNTRYLCGDFDGMGHTISGLSVNATARWAGLFGKYGYGTISNLTVKGNVYSTGNTVGGIAGDIIAGGLDNCAFEGNVTGNYQVGGLVGNMSLDNGTQNITNCYTSGGTVKGLSTDTNNNQVGGLVGTAYAATAGAINIVDSYSTMNVERANATLTPGGGLCGKMSTTTTTLNITNSFFAGTVGGTDGAPIAVSATTTSTFNNVFYKTTSVTGTASGMLTGATACTPEAFAGTTETGKVVDLLNNGRNPVVWGQGATNPILATLPVMTALTVSTGSLVFSADVLNYSLFLSNNTTTLDVTPTVEDGVTVTVNDQPATSGTAKTVSLAADTTTVINVKISRDGVDITYVINATCGDIWDGTTALAYPNADESDAGTKSNPYQIARAEHLAYMRDQINAGNGQTAYYELVADIDLCQQQWTPIGTSSKQFAGTFDGQGHTISGLYINTAAVDQGLFGYTYGNTTIKNVKVVDADISAYYYIGGIVAHPAGALGQKLTLADCSFSGSIYALVGETSSADIAGAGGLIGVVESGDVLIDNCTVEAGTTITAKRGATLTWAFSGVGGLVGAAQAASAITVTIKNSSSAANIICVKNDGTSKDASGVGGIMGLVRNSGKSDSTSVVKVVMEKCYSTGTASASTTAGLLGQLRNPAPAEAEITDCYSTMTGLSNGLFGGYNNRTGEGKVNNVGGTVDKFTFRLSNSYFAGTAAQPISPAPSAGMNVTIDNVYYLTGSGSATNAVKDSLNDTTISITNVAEKNAVELASPEFVALLNNGRSMAVWGQGTTHPILLVYPKLQNIKLSKGTMTFESSVYEYQTYVSSVFTSISVTPTAEDPAITIKVGDQDVASGTPATVALTGETTDVLVKATLNGVTTVYTVKVTLLDGWDGITAIPFPNIEDTTAGTKENPYLITCAENLYFLELLSKDGVAVKDNTTKITTTTLILGDDTYTVQYPNSYLGNLYGAFFKITEDINMNGKPFAFTNFRGRLDGGDHTVKNFTATNGLFTAITYGKVANLHAEGTVSGSGSVGGFAGALQGGADLTNCSFTGTVTGTSTTGNVGGLVGRTVPYSGGDTGQEFDLVACWTSGTVTGAGGNIGGLVGSVVKTTAYNSFLTMKDSYSTMTVTSTAATIDNMAGLVADNTGDVVYRNSFFAGNIASAYPIGFDAVNTIGSVYYKEDSCNTTTSANASFVGGTKKTVAEFKSDAFVALLNKYAAPGVVWAKGTDYPTLTYTAPADGTAAPADPFYLSGLAIEHVAYTFAPATFSYSLEIPYSADKIHLLPTAPADVTVTVDGQVVESEAISQAIALEVGVEKTIAVRVAMGDSYTNYVVKLTRREQPANGVWDGALEPIDTKNGAGDEIDNPIYINTPGQLAFLSAMVNGQEVFLNGKIHKGPSANGNIYSGKYFEITADLVMNDVADYENWRTNAPANDFKPIGFHSDEEGVSRYFSGIINGNQHKITGLYISGKDSTGAGGTGLFGSINGGVARNVHVVQSYVKGGQRVGGIVGRPRGSVKLQNCVFSGIVESTYISTTSTSQVGGLIGDAVARVYIESCWTEGEVIGGNALGGLMGQLYMQTGAEIKNSYSTMTLSPQGGCDLGIGGLIGLLSGNSGTVDVFRSHFAGKVPTNTPFIGARSEKCNAVITASDTVYYREDSYVGTVDEANTYEAVERTVEEFTDGTLTEELNNLVEYGDYWKWKTGDECPVSDGVLLVTDYRDHTSDEHYDDGEWYVDFINKPGGTLKNPGSGNGNGSGDGADDDYLNSETGEASVASAVLILALISAIAAFLLARRKRSVN